MNNDMARKLNNHIETRRMNGADSNAIQKKAAQKSNYPNINMPADTFVQAESVTQESEKPFFVSDSVKNSTQEFLKSPEYTEAYINFCDSLVNEGIELIEAIDKTDKVFKALKNENLYN